jgi:hypothetical protein
MKKNNDVGNKKEDVDANQEEVDQYNVGLPEEGTLLHERSFSRFFE